jgi:hypothetical protein
LDQRSCSRGWLSEWRTQSSIEQRGDTYEELARIPTIPGARTALIVPERDRLYLAVQASGGEGAAVWVVRGAGDTERAQPCDGHNVVTWFRQGQ